LNGQKATGAKTETMRIRPTGVAHKGADYTCRRYFFPSASVHGGPGNMVKVFPTPQIKTIAWCEIDLAPDTDRECREAAR
jgi:hypothetical protein